MNENRLPFVKLNIKWYVYLIWAAIGAVSSLVLNFLFYYLGLTKVDSYVEAADGLYGISSSISVLIVLYVIATPMLEEIIFRYFIFNFLQRHIKKAAVTILLTAALFGVYHLNPVQMLYGFLMGLIITYGYYKHRVLTIPFLVHATANAVALFVTFA